MHFSEQLDDIKEELSGKTSAEVGELCRFAFNGDQTNDRIITLMDAGMDCDPNYMGNVVSLYTLFITLISSALTNLFLYLSSHINILLKSIVNQTISKTIATEIYARKKLTLGDNMADWGQEDVINAIGLAGIRPSDADTLTGDTAAAV